ncbi:MAG: hypothetical protein ACREGB_03270, partial [Candidatus Saccharimonadales bacterium]
MATDDLNQDNIDGVLAAAHAVKEDFEGEYEAAKKALIDRERKRTADLRALDTAKAVVDERHAHETKPLAEKLDEYDRIEEQRKAQPPADVAPEPQAEPEPESQTPAEPDASNDGDHTSVDLPPVRPEPTQGPASDLQYLNPRNWGGRAWLLAIIGAILGEVLARATYDPMWSHVHHGWHVVLVILWFLV